MTLEELWQLFPITLAEHDDGWAAQYAEENDMDMIFVCYSVENFIKDTDAAMLAQ